MMTLPESRLRCQQRLDVARHARRNSGRRAGHDGEDHTTEDTLIAAGFAARRRPAGQCLSWAQSRPSQHTVQPALALAVRITRRRARRDGWNMTPHHLHHIARRSLTLFLNPGCPQCGGRGQIPATPPQNARLMRYQCCHTCHGSGTQPLPEHHRREVATILDDLTRQHAEYLTLMRRALRG